MLKSAQDFLQTRFAKHLARVGGIFGLFAIVFSSIQYIRETQSPIVLLLIVCAIVFTPTFFLGREIYRKMYGRYIEFEGSSKEFTLFKWYRIREAVVLSRKDDSYFIALTWMKMSRALLSALAAISALVVLIRMKHAHESMDMFQLVGLNIPNHVAVDIIFFSFIFTSCWYICLNILEIHIISKTMCEDIVAEHKGLPSPLDLE